MHPYRRINGWYGRNRVFAWACILVAVNQLGFGGIIPAVPLYAESFDVSQTLIGIAIAVYGLARFLGSLPAGRIADGWGRRWSIAVGGFVTVGGNVICALAPDFPLFLLGRFVAGMGAAMVLTGVQITIADITTKESRGRVMALYMSIFLFAVGFGPLPGGYMAEHFGLTAPFYAYAILGGLVTLLALLRMPETRGFRPSGGSEQTVVRMPFSAQVRILSRYPAFLMVSLVSFASFFARTGGLFTIVPQRAESAMGLGPGEIGLGLSMMSFVALAVGYPAGMLSDRFGRKWVIVPAALLSGVSMAGFGWAFDFNTFLLCCIVWAIASGISAAAPAAYAADIAPAGMIAAAMSTYRMLADTGYVAGPFLLGLTADLGDSAVSLYGTAALLLICGLLFARFAPESNRGETMRHEPARTAAD